MPLRLFSLQEANGLIPRLEEDLAEASRLTSRMRDCRDQLVDLRIIWGEKVEDPACEGAAEYAGYRDEFSRLELQLERLMAGVSELGCEIKDVEAGLVDFCTPRGEDVVYLCWRRGEKSIGYWHGMQDGFAGRRPMSEF